MSSRKGDNKKRGQKYQNRIAFKNNLHDTSKTTKVINSIVVQGVCKRCREIIEWRKKYSKYKPLTAPKKWLVCFIYGLRGFQSRQISFDGKLRQLHAKLTQKSN